MEWFNEFLGSRLFFAITASVVVFILLSIVKRIAWRVFERAAKATSVEWDDELLSKLSGPVRTLVLFFSLLIGVNLYPELIQKHTALKNLQPIGFILISTWILNRTIVVLLKSFLSTKQISTGTIQFISSIVQAGVWVTGLLGLLDTLGISITPILASLGVGSLAVALALQDTLGNLFAGIYLYFDRPISVGDYIRLEDGSEGFIYKIGWRSTQIKLPADNIIVMPNTKMSNSVITNYDLSQSECAVTLPLGVAYESNLEHVEAIAIKVAKEVMARVSGAANGTEPVLRFTSFADSSINFNLILRVKHKSEQPILIHEMIKSIHATFGKEKIDIPFPQRVVHVTKTSATVDVGGLKV